MKYAKKYISTILFSVVSLLTGLILGIQLPKFLNPPKDDLLASLYARDEIVDMKEKQQQVTEPTITTETKIVYEYRYADDDITESSQVSPPYFLVGLTEDELVDTLSDWEVLSFAPKEVVLLKRFVGKSDEYFIVGEKDGYVAVFYQHEVNGNILKEQTDKAISALPIEDQEKLSKGIYVFGEDALFRLLEDYDY